MEDQITSKYAGIWLDLKQAIIVILENGNEHMEKIDSDLDIGKVKGGSRMVTPYGPQDAVSESKMLARKNAQLQDYFNRIMEKLTTVDEILILGPAETKDRFEAAVRDNHNLKNKLAVTQTVDSMTDNQIKAKVKSYFEATGAH